MPDRLETAPSGRAGCRACGLKIEKSALRFGEELPASYGDAADGTAVFWFHPACAAHRRPEKFLALAKDDERGAPLGDRHTLIAAAEAGIAAPKLPRLAGAERSPSARARCRHCQIAIPQGVWRIRLSTFADTGFFDPLGFLHTGCVASYFGSTAIADRLQQAAPGLSPPELAEIAAEIAMPGAPAAST